MPEDSYSASLYALLSDKVRERNGAISTLRSILPLEVKQLEFTNESAQNVLKSFLNLLQAELRIARKSSNSASSASFSSALKELKWIISLLDENFPRIDLSGIVLELIDRLTDVLGANCGGFTEVLYILNQQIFSKSLYLSLFKGSKLAARSHRLIAILNEKLQSADSHEPYIKALSFLAISLPEPLKLESSTYEMLHGSFIWYLSTSNPKNDNCFLLSAVNCLLLDYFEHSRKFGLRYFEFFIPLIKYSKSLTSFSKAIEYFTLMRNDLPEEHVSLLTPLLEKELEESQLFSIDPVTFCRQILAETHTSLSEICRFSFLKLCDDFKVKSSCAHFSLFRLLKGTYSSTISTAVTSNSFSTASIITAVNSHAHLWNSLIKFHSQYVIDDMNWYKIWYICRNPQIFENNIKVEELDEFVTKDLLNGHLEPFTLESLAVYFNFRFKNLWWTSSAESMFKLFLSSALNTLIETQRVSLELFKCLFSPLGFEMLPGDVIEDVKALDFHTFFKKLDQYERKRNECLDFDVCEYKAKKSCMSVSETGQISALLDDLPKYYYEALESFSSKLQEIMGLNDTNVYTCGESQSSVKSKQSESNNLNFKFLIFLIGLLGSPKNEEGLNFSWISEISHSTSIKSTIITEVLQRIGPLIADRVKLDTLLSHLIPKYSEIQSKQKINLEEFDEFDEFKTNRNSEYEVNLMTPEVFKLQQQQNAKKSKSSGTEDLLIVKISRILYSIYFKSKNDTESTQILNDWKIYTKEVLEIDIDSEIENENTRASTLNNTQDVANAFREAMPFFEFPVGLKSIVLNPHIDPSIVLPNPSILYKKLQTPEQWIPFILLVLKSERSTMKLSTEWLISCFTSLESIDESSLLHLIIKKNVPPSIAYNLLLTWVNDPSKLIKLFPFGLFTSSPCDFILKSPHFPVILSKFPSINSIINIFHGSDENSNVILRNSNYLVASGFLEEASAKISNRKPIDLSFLKTPAVNSSLKFLPLVTALLSHGQWYPWSVVSLALQSLAKMFKLSAATDFSEVFNPIHSILILRSLIPTIHCSDFLENLFSTIPILSHHPQLIKLTRKLCKQSQLKASLNSKNMITDDDDDPAFDFSNTEDNLDLVTFIFYYGHFTTFSTDAFSPNLFELLYRILNFTNVNGNRQFPLDSSSCGHQRIRDDLKMLILPLGSRIICFDPSKKKLKNSSASFCPNWSNFDSSVFLKDLCKYLSNFIDSDPLTPFLQDFLECDEEFDNFFLKFLLRKQLETLNTKSSSFSIIPELIKQLIGGLEQSTKECQVKVLVEVLHLIIELTPIGPNVVDTFLRRFNFNIKIFKTLQDSNPKTALYFNSLVRESPKLTNVELELHEMAELLEGTDEGEEYLAIVKKRLSKFENFETEWPIENNLKLKKLQIDSSILWMDRRWFDKNDFNPKELNLKEFKEQSKKLNYLYKLFNGKEATENIIEYDDALKLIENCVKNKKQPNFKEILKISENPNRKHFQTISLLALCSPKLEQISKHLLADMKSKIHWNNGEFEEAIEAAKGALSLIPVTMPDECKALLLSRIGEWTAASKSERPSNILSQYLEKAMTLCENSSTFSPNSLAQIHIKVARFVDAQYQQIKESEDFKSRAKLLEESRNALSAARASSSNISASQDRRQIEIGISTLRSQYDLDMQEYSERLRSLKSFLLKSIQNYIYALSFGVSSANDQMAAISRLCALWFSNPDFNDINELINNAIPSNGSTKRSLPLQLFLPLIYQLAARASYDKTAKTLTPFQRTLIRLLVQLTINHPFDCIYQLLALKAGNTIDGLDPSISKKRKLLETETAAASEADLRAAAASLIIDQTKKVSNLASIIGAVEKLTDAYIELANVSPPVNALKSSSRVEFGQNLKIRQLLYPLPSDSPLRLIPIPTGPVDGNRFAGLIDGYKLLGGINLPKQIEAVSVSGSRHSQLVKGKDDVRQDAVMEQVFLRVNRLLSADEETRRRALSIRTYRVIPLRPLVGLLEWVSDSIPLATYLSEAHERLRPGDLHPSKCRDLLKLEAERPGSTVQSKLNVLLKDIGQRFRPVLRYFFFEHFNVKDWWRAKQAYTSSMATSSIVGWIVGLGDRHGMNILLDKRTGQVVHIDLNMIFEAGRTLRVPERVPFRLTPDCIDGLGPEGIGLEGPFKNHAVAALKVLRRERSLLMMIMDVFKYDPLQKWTGIAKAIENNNNNNNNNNHNSNNNNVTINSINTSSSTTDLISKEADRALMRIKEKLEGREEGVVLSESGHVSFLIQTASDPELLCQMYFGWQAYF